MPGSNSKNHVDHGRVLLPVDVQIRAEHDLLTWNYHQMRVHSVARRGQRQHVVLFCRVTRASFSYVMDVMLIMFFIATLGFCAYGVPIDALHDRCSVTLTLLLTTVAFKLVLAEGMPKVSYLTFMDQYVFVSFFLLFLITMEQAIIASIYGVADTVNDPSLNKFWWKAALPGDSDEWTDEETKERSSIVKLEEKLMEVFLMAWCLFNFFMIGRAWWYTHDNKRTFGKTIRAESQNNHRSLHMIGAGIKRKCIEHGGFRDHVAATNELILMEKTVGNYTHFRCTCAACTLRSACGARFSTEMYHSRMPLDPTHVRLKLFHACDQ
jgi:hypothetical protein